MRKNISKILALLLTIALCIGCFGVLAACGNDVPPNSGVVTPDDGDTTPDDGNDDPDDGNDDPDITPPDDANAGAAVDFADSFYTAAGWQIMTKNEGSAVVEDAGGVPIALSDGSLRFFNANQAKEIGDLSDGKVSFMLKATSDWQLWFRSSSVHNTTSNNFQLKYDTGVLSLSASGASGTLAAAPAVNDYAECEWNRFDVVFKDEGSLTTIKLYIDGKKVNLAAGTASVNTEIVDGNMVYNRTANFTLGNYMIVKTWGGDSVLQLKPVAKAEEADTVTKIACIGDSITAGAGASPYWTKGYPQQLQELAGGDYSIVNFGNSGKILRTPHADSYWTTDEYKGVKLFKPDIAIIMLGSNDSKTELSPATDKETFKTTLRAMIAELKTVNADIEIIINTSPTAYGNPYTISNDNITNIINPAQEEVAAEDGHTLVDINEYTKNKSMLFPDSVHPNNTGYKMIAEILNFVITGQTMPDGFTDKYNDPAADTIGEPNDFDDAFYTPANWQQMANDGGSAPVTANGGIKFYQSNIGYYVGYTATQHISFMLKSDATGSGGWSIRFRASDNDNNAESYYTLGYGWGKIFIADKSGAWLTQAVSDEYVEDAWTRFDIVMTENEGSLTLKVYINTKQLMLSESTVAEDITYENGAMVDASPLTGVWMGVKVWGVNLTLRKVNYTPSDAVKVACVGDSITVGQGASAGKTYPEQMAEILGLGYEVGNFGHSGATLLPQSDIVNWAVSYWDQSAFSDSKEMAADIVIIMLGTNDAHIYTWGSGKSALFEQKMKELMGVYRQINPDVKFVIASSPTCYDIDATNNHYTMRGVNLEGAIWELQKKIATEEGGVFADIATLTTDMQSNFPDGVHPNDTGYTIIATEMAAKVIEAVRPS